MVKPTDTIDCPNILWICTDQQRYDTIGALGNPHIRTPNLDRLVSDGVAFTHTYCQSPICTPSRASFMTGCYPSSVHACMNRNAYWSEAAPLVSKLLADAGYDCGLVGKLHLADCKWRMEPRPRDDGYRVFHPSQNSRDRWPGGVNEYVEWAKKQGGVFGGRDNLLLDSRPELHQTTWCADRAIEFMESTGQSPWLISVHPFDPHKPFDPPAEYARRYDAEALPDPLFRDSDIAAQRALQEVDFQTAVRRPEEFNARQIKAKYYAMIELIDHNVGRLLDALERSGQREDTVVIFMSDHGEMLGDHGLLLKGCRFYEGLVRVPLIISWPSRFGCGIQSHDLVELTDLVPTVLEIAEVPLPRHVQGLSLLPVLSGAGDGLRRDSVRCEYYRALQEGNQVTNYHGSYATMIRNRRHKLVVYHGHPKGELFDLDADPGEFENLWNSPEHEAIRFALLKKSFDALAWAVDVGPDPPAKP